MIAWGDAQKKNSIFTTIAESIDKVFAREHRPKSLDYEDEEYVNKDEDSLMLAVMTKIMMVFGGIIVVALLLLCSRKCIHFLKSTLTG